MPKPIDFPPPEPPRRRVRITCVEGLADKSLLGKVGEATEEPRIRVEWRDERGRRCYAFPFARCVEDDEN